jgi:TolA-binding protein
MNAPSPRCREDLFARSRRAPLSAVEQRALDAHLAVCELCRAARGFALLYDAIPDRASARDDALIARLADRVASGAAARRPHRRPRVVAIAAGVALMVAAGGAAAWVSVRALRARSAEGEGDARLVPSRAHVGARVARATQSVAANAGDEAPHDAPTPDDRPVHDDKRVSRHHVGRERISAPQPAVAKAAPTAAELFAEANAARRALDLRGATDLYLTLDRRFPDSEEALVAQVSAGDLLSRLGEPAAALRAFDRYLARRPAGALAPEALFGRARALQRLGRRQDEIDCWRQLQRSFPGSIYESAARQRLGELSR